MNTARFQELGVKAASNNGYLSIEDYDEFKALVNEGLIGYKGDNPLFINPSKETRPVKESLTLYQYNGHKITITKDSYLL